ncbi:BirA family transcriptional regulator, biotin operon repressor / biotin-[acetyl-CoA-carboxylase] ligase [Fodinibius salinus]|uniref:BirA family transcriptional regulator, biotin operon repressor / biotin-[acetyl-CoA-carboxylase] ligase n=1 Tax=Fodinibius salinus TaxID=860790 RepID=A0A5D3YEF2_9BACT|nr:biotin--[acetyl-CoA-carboxylase] ligase [Fodinibius salinus]TYP91732.1 BirA family transcriptional regulator, biotin operon repressor / biotin-[acetyl-CoA-carboxylase] ligase [Fodinibius salinus]
MYSTFDQSVYQQELSTQWLGHSFSYFEELESTNSHVKNISAEEVTHGMVCLADDQIKGRGQYERNWESESGENLTFSLVFRPQTTDRFHVLTLACALAIVDYIDELLPNSNVCIKWPNDVMIDQKKVAGLLTETMFSGNTLDRLIIGIGLNVNQKAFSSEVSGKATSIAIEKGQTVERENLLSELLSRIEYNYNLWQRRRQDLLKSINRNIIGYGQWIELIVNGQLLEDTFKMLGINKAGQLVVLGEDGELKSFSYEQIRLVTD